MARNRRFSPNYLLLVPLLIVLIIAVGCGEDATSTPLPTNTPTTAPATPVPTVVQATSTPTATPTPPPTRTPTPTAAPLPTPTPGFFSSAKVDRLVFSHAGATNEANVASMGVVVDSQLRPMHETLINTDVDGLAYVPQLATKWEMRPDAMAWTFWLQEDVPFHSGFGEFTAKDVVHSWEVATLEDAVCHDAAPWRKLLGSAQNFEIVNDHEVVYNLTRAEPDLDWHLSTKLGCMYMYSKAQWDEDGRDALMARPAGTGSYQFMERKLGASLLFERVEDHWRQTPEFKELMLAFVSEEATRLAMILTGEAHIVQLARDLHPEAISRGNKVVTANLAIRPAILFFGGQYYLTPEKFDPDLPFADVKVREAMVRAIDRQEIIDEIFYGQAVNGYFNYNVASEQGWDPSWNTRAPDLYGYDQERSMELLAEAGYADGFEFTLYVNKWGSMPEWVPMLEALAIMWENVGLTVNMVETEFGRVREEYRDKASHGKMWGWPGGAARPPHLGYTVGYQSSAEEGGVVFAYESAAIDEVLERLGATIDPVQREQLQRQVGEELLVNYSSLPLFANATQAIIDPEVVADYKLPGVYYGYSHLEYIVAAR